MKSRREFIGNAAGIGIGLAAGTADALALAAQQPAPGAAPTPGTSQDLNLANGRIHTLDARNSVVSAVAVLAIVVGIRMLEETPLASDWVRARSESSGA